MSNPHTVIGFDASLDDVALVVMTRDHDGTWRVDRTDGPDAAELHLWAERFVRRNTPEPPQPTGPSLAEQAAQWLTEYADPQFQLTAERRELLTAMYDQMLREGKVSIARYVQRTRRRTP